jgi:hypothetical protein
MQHICYKYFQNSRLCYKSLVRSGVFMLKTFLDKKRNKIINLLCHMKIIIQINTNKKKRQGKY